MRGLRGCGHMVRLRLNLNIVRLTRMKMLHTGRLGIVDIMHFFTRTVKMVPFPARNTGWSNIRPNYGQRQSLDHLSSTMRSSNFEAQPTHPATLLCTKINPIFNTPLLCHGIRPSLATRLTTAVLILLQQITFSFKMSPSNPIVAMDVGTMVHTNRPPPSTTAHLLVGT